MIIHTKDIDTMMQLLLSMLRQRGENCIEVKHIDEYWHIGHPDWVDFSREPSLSVGSLEDDWSELVRMKDGRMATPVDLDRLAAVLHAISAIIAPPKG